MDLEHIIIATLTAISSGGVVALLKFRNDNRLTEASVDKTQAEAWALLVENLAKRVAALELSVAEKDRRIAEQDKRIAELEHDNHKLAQTVSDQATEIELLRKNREARDAQIAALQERIDLLAEEEKGE